MTVMTGRPEAPLPETGPLVPLARRLRELREKKGMSYREMAEIAKYTAPALSTAANGKKLPPLERVRAYVNALGVDEFVRGEVEQLWQQARAETVRTRASRRRADAAVPESSYQAGPDLSVIIPFVSESSVYFSADPRQVNTFEEFSAALNQIMSESGMNVAQLIRQSAMPTGAGDQMVQLKKTTVYDVLGGKARPSPGFTQVFLRTCGMDGDRVEAWVARLRHLQVITSAVEELARNPHQGGSAIEEIRTALRRPQQGDLHLPIPSTFAVDDFVITTPEQDHMTPAHQQEDEADPNSRLRVALTISTGMAIILAIILIWVLAQNS